MDHSLINGRNPSADDRRALARAGAMTLERVVILNDSFGRGGATHVAMAEVRALVERVPGEKRYLELDSPYGHMASGVEWRRLEGELRWLLEG